VTIGDVAKAHDLQTRSDFDAQYLRYCVDENEGKISCLVQAPDAEAARHCSSQGTRPCRRRDLPGREGVWLSPIVDRPSPEHGGGQMRTSR
jgi:hypothetical protein